MKKGWILCALLWCHTLFAFDFHACQCIPVLHEGRVKPLDSVARQTLVLIHGKQTLSQNGKKISAIQWLLDLLLCEREVAMIPLIPISHPEILNTLGKKESTYYSMNELRPHVEQIYPIATHALKLDARDRDAFQRDIITLWQRIVLYLRLSHTLWIANVDNAMEELDALQTLLTSNKENHDALHQWFSQRYHFLAESSHFSFLPPYEQKRWQSIGESLLAYIQGDELHPSVHTCIRICTAYQQGELLSFNRAVYEHLETVKAWLPKMKLEVLYNKTQPFQCSIYLYILALLLAMCAKITQHRLFSTGSFVLFIIGFVLHSLGIITRIFLEGRPPVTNLYSSAIFVGWSTALFSLYLEKKTKRLIGTVVGTAVGMLTLIIAHHLSTGSDTLGVVRAVLNSNFWLSTHVITVTLGYGTTFLAGGFASIAILRSTMIPLSRISSMRMLQLIYGSLCGSAILMITGTILGGFWADQSWGRFWGWDPKENGALILILWNVLTLHAYWSGFIHWRGILTMAALGNALAALCWFGVNLLGVGFHSYGFFHGTFGALSAFILVQCMIAGIGLRARYQLK